MNNAAYIAAHRARSARRAQLSTLKLSSSSTMSTSSEAITALEYHAKQYAAARAILALRANALEKEVAAATQRKLPGIRTALAEAANHQAQLVAAIEQHPELFTRPRTMTLHGIKFGFAKGKGAVEWDVEDTVLVERIEKLFKDEPELLQQLIKTTKKPSANALKELDAKVVAKLGVTVEATGDYVFVKAADSEVDALVKRLLKEGNVEEAAQEAAAS